MVISQSKNKSVKPVVHKVSDPTAEARLAEARKKFEDAKTEPRSEVAQSHTYQTSPDVIPWEFKVKNGPNKGQTISGKSIGFWSVANPKSSYLAIKLKINHVKAILACIDDGKRQELEDLILIYEEQRKAQNEEETEE